MTAEGSSPRADAAGPRRVEVDCDHCGARERRTRMDFGEYRIVRCTRCGLDYLSPRPHAADLPALYAEEYFRAELGRSNFADTAAERERLIREKGHLLRYVVGHHARGRLLDVGCATGYFLECARRAGFAVKGIEYSEFAAGIARELTGAPVFVGDLAAAAAAGFVAPDEFHVITLSHVLEHVPGPAVELARIFTALARGGVVVIRVPDFGGLHARRHGAEWPGLDVPRHLYHFRPSTLRRCLRAAGFEVVAFDYAIDDPVIRPIEWARRAVRSAVGVDRPSRGGGRDAIGRPVPPRPLERPPLRRIVHRLLYPFRGRTMTFVARKP